MKKEVSTPFCLSHKPSLYNSSLRPLYLIGQRKKVVKKSGALI
jgi:hypothetical protein